MRDLLLGVLVAAVVVTLFVVLAWLGQVIAP